MTNMFKKNNRFSSLLQDNSSDYKKQLPRNNSRNNSRNNRRNYSNPSFGGKYESKDNKFINTIREEQKRKEIEESLLIDNFPSLVDKTSSSYIIDKNYIDKVNQSPVTPPIKTDELLPGWVQLVKRGVYSNKFSTPPLKYKKDYITIFNNLCINYEKWLNEYIETWGEEEYEKIYLFPNYDYNQYDDSDSEDETSDDEEI